MRRSALPPLLASESGVRRSQRRAVRALWYRILPASIIGIFLAEWFLMRIFDLWGWQGGARVALIDATLLAFLTLPGLYLVVLRPVAHLATALAVASVDARFRGVVEAMTDGVVLGDPTSGRIRFANPAALELLGFSGGELDGAEITLLVPDALRDQHREGMRRYPETGEVPSYGPTETEARAKDGQRIPIEFTLISPTLHEQGMVVAVLRDLRQRKRIALYETLLPTCSVCRRIRDDTGVERGHGHWDSLESYVQRHSSARLSHTFCPECSVEYRRTHGLPPKAELT